MAILVDAARWPWRDTYWCHLVSDTELSELHEFARQLGCRRVGFQGDHYDIDIVSRDQAIELGAEPVESRELVRRLKSAGLRLRPSQFAKWNMVTRGGAAAIQPGKLPEEIEVLAAKAEGFFELSRERADGTTSSAIVLFGDEPVELPAEDPLIGRFIRVDRDGSWSIEVFAPTPTPQE